MTEEDARAKAIALYDNCRDDCRVVAEAKIALAFAELYLEAFTAGAQFAVLYDVQKRRAEHDALGDSGVFH